MQVRYKNKHGEYVQGTSSRFNTHGVGEVICYFGDDCESMFISELEVLIGNTWKSLGDAFDNKDIVPNNINTDFDEPHSEAEKQQGFNWY